jgi:hypothetical protein
MTDTTLTNPDEMLQLIEELRALGPRSELLLKAIGLLDSDVDALRGLLAPILTGTELLLQNTPGNLTASQIETLDAINEAALQLIAVLDNSEVLTGSLRGYTRLTSPEPPARVEPAPPRRKAPSPRGRLTPRGIQAAPQKPEGMTAFLTVQEAGDYLGLPLAVVQSISALQPTRVKDQYLYRTADVERFRIEMFEPNHEVAGADETEPEGQDVEQ